MNPRLMLVLAVAGAAGLVAWKTGVMEVVFSGAAAPSADTGAVDAGSAVSSARGAAGGWWAGNQGWILATAVPMLLVALGVRFVWNRLPDILRYPLVALIGAGVLLAAGGVL